MPEFPQVVGKSGEEAKAIILHEHPDFNVHVLAEGSPCTMDFRTNRVRVFVNGQGIVTSVPYTG